MVKRLTKAQVTHILTRFDNASDEKAPKKPGAFPKELCCKMAAKVEVEISTDFLGRPCIVEYDTPNALDSVVSQQPAAYRRAYAKWNDAMSAYDKAKKEFYTKRANARLRLEEKLLFMGDDLDIDAVLSAALKSLT